MYDMVRDLAFLGNAVYLRDIILKLNNKSDKNLNLEIQTHAKMLVSQASKLIEDLEESKRIIENLENENEILREELAKKPTAGRKRVYDDKKRAEISAYYNKNSYKDTLSHFGISPDTLNRIIREQR